MQQKQQPSQKPQLVQDQSLLSQEYKVNRFHTLIGCLIVQFSSGIIPIWSNANIYFLSYFKNHSNPQTSKSSNSYILIATVFPMCIFLLFSTKLCQYFGYCKLIRLCSYTFVISQFIPYFQFSLIICTIFLFIIPITASTISFVPLYHCLWTYYEKKKNIVTGWSLVCYGVGGVGFNLLFMYLVNPNNQEASQIDQQGWIYFGKEISHNVIIATRIIYAIVAVCFLVGAQFIKKQGEQDKANNNRISKKQTNDKNGKHTKLEEQLQEYHHNTNIQNKKQQQQSPSPILNKQQQNKQQLQLQKISSQSSFNLKEYLFSSKFLIIFFNILFLDFYISFLLNNFKLIYLQQINDDHFLGYCLVVNTITAILGSFLWGYIGERYKFVKTMLMLTIVDMGIKILGIWSADTKIMLIVLMGLIGITSRGMATIAGPGLIELFGLEIGTKLLPFKALAVIGSYICVPVLQLIFLQILTPFTFMNCLIMVNLCIILSTFYLMKKIQKQKDNPQSDQIFYT